MRINVVFAVPPTSVKYSNWHDGFTAAMRLIAAEHDVTWLNVHPLAPGHQSAAARMFECDFLLVKSNFGWIPDVAYMKQDLRVGRRPPVGLMISGSITPDALDLRRFDVLFYETEWYRPTIAKHPQVVHAFGIDTDVMKPPRGEGGGERDIDWLMVGRPASFKHPEALLAQKGTRMLVGEIHGAGEQVATLEASGVLVRDFVGYDELADIYGRARVLLVAAELQGGGERSILEARACGVEVQLLSDNPKLKELVGGPVYSHRYYAAQLSEGIDSVVNSQGGSVHSTRMYSAARLANGKVRRVPNALRWQIGRARSILRSSLPVRG